VNVNASKFRILRLREPRELDLVRIGDDLQQKVHRHLRGGDQPLSVRVVAGLFPASVLARPGAG
jgi:hypothetical protein